MEKKFKFKMRVIFIIAILFGLLGIFNLIKMIEKILGN